MLKQGLIGVLVFSIVTPAFASKQRQESCAITAGIVAKAVEARIAGRTLSQTKADLARDGSGITGIYKATIPALVDMVYGFERSTLGDGVVDDYKVQCLKF